MATFLHNLMEGLRGREKFLEDKLSTIKEAKSEGQYVQEYRDLQKDLTSFKERVAELQAEGKDFDEHFERKIKDDHRELEVRIDTWSKNWDPKH